MQEKLRNFFNARNIYCIISICVLIMIVVLGSMFLGPKLVDIAKDPQGFKDYLSQYNGIKSYLIFILIQFLQVIFAFIPGEFIEIAAGYIYGTFGGLIICSIGAFTASLLVFYLTRLLGNKFSQIMISNKDLKRLKFLNDEKKLEIIFAILFFLPGTPKDLLTYFAGVTKMKFSVFLIISTVCRIPSIITSTMAGNALGEENYLHSIIIFIITGIIAIIGYIIYSKYSIHQGKQKKTKDCEL